MFNYQQHSEIHFQLLVLLAQVVVRIGSLEVVEVVVLISLEEAVALEDHMQEEQTVL